MEMSAESLIQLSIQQTKIHSEIFGMEFKISTLHNSDKTRNSLYCRNFKLWNKGLIENLKNKEILLEKFWDQNIRTK